MPDQDRWRPEWDRMGWEDRDRPNSPYASERYAPETDAYRRDDRFDEPRSFGERDDRPGGRGRGYGDRGRAFGHRPYGERPRGGAQDDRRFGEGATNREYRNLGGYPYDDRGPYYGPAQRGPADPRGAEASTYAERLDAYRRAYGSAPADFGATYAAGRTDYEPDRYVPNPRDGRGEDDGRSFWAMAGDEVASWFGDRGAERRRAWDARHIGRGPKSYKRADNRIHEDVNDRLTEDPYLDASDIDVLVTDGEVTLNGFIVDRADKRRAEDMAERVSGVKHVQNNLRVRAGDFAGGQDTSRSATGEPISDRVSRITDSDA